jgi:hypothetical protein
MPNPITFIKIISNMIFDKSRNNHGNHGKLALPSALIILFPIIQSARKAQKQ